MIMAFIGYLYAQQQTLPQSRVLCEWWHCEAMSYLLSVLYYIIQKRWAFTYGTFIIMLMHHVFKCINLVEFLHIIQYI